MIMKEEQHTTKKEVVSKVETQVQNIDKIKYIPMIQKVERHTTENQIIHFFKKKIDNNLLMNYILNISHKFKEKRFFKRERSQ